MIRRRAARVWLLVPLLALAGARGVPALSRPHDPVVVRGAQLTPVLPVRDLARLRLYRVRDGAWEPIPYQFDARDRHGDLAHDAPDGMLDAHDELVFMAADCGPRAGEDLAVPTASREAVELAVRDPRDGRAAYAYLFAFDAPPRRAARPPYVTIAADGHRAASEFYTVDYAPGRNFYTGLRVSARAGGNGHNLLRQSKMLGEPTLRLLFTDLRLRFDEQSTVVRVTATRGGPVRAIRQVELAVDLGRFFPDLPNGIVHTYHYATAVDAPSRVSVPWLVLEALRDFRFENVVVFDPAVQPLRYWDAAHPEGVALGPQAPPPRDDDHEWWAASSPAGAFLQHLDIPETWRRWGIARGAVTRVRNAADGAEPVAGYSLVHMTRLRESGDFAVRQLLVVLPDGVTPTAVEEALAITRAPLQVEVRRLR